MTEQGRAVRLGMQLGRLQDRAAVEMAFGAGGGSRPRAGNEMRHGWRWWRTNAEIGCIN